MVYKAEENIAAADLSIPDFWPGFFFFPFPPGDTKTRTETVLPGRRILTPGQDDQSYHTDLNL